MDNRTKQNLIVTVTGVAGFVILTNLTVIFEWLGEIFGIIGIIFFIPLMAVVLEIVKEDANYRIHKNKVVKKILT